MAYTLDLIPYNFFLWGYVKSQYIKRTLEALKEAICIEIHRIPQEIFEKVMQKLHFA